ncbi:MAG: MMPL family transporter, partial [Thermoplasmata archaeon]|nr:MMPL family transporter [Thermoplasmata archaeon]
LMYYDSGSEAYTASVVRQQVTARNDADNLVITDEATEDIVGFKGGKASLTGGVVLIQKVIDQLSDSQVQSTIISTIFALAILTLIYRSITLGVVSISPVIVAMSLTLGSMWVLGISLNALTIMITSLTIGLGIDYSIHVVERFREEEKEHRPSKALHRTLENTGAALLISALTTIFGFGVLVLAGIPIFSDFGIVTAVMIVYSMLAAVIVTPIVMMWLARRKIRAGRGTEAVVETGEEVSEHGEDDGSGNVIGPEV